MTAGPARAWHGRCVGARDVSSKYWFCLVLSLCVLAAWRPRAAAQPKGADVKPEDTESDGYWSQGEPRPFVSTRSELGIPYAKPYLSAGYGLPHWIWAGVDVNAITTLEFVQGYFGAHAALPVLDLAVGARDTLSFQKPFLDSPPFTRSEVLDAAGEKARYWAFEAEATAIAPLPYSALVVDFILVRLLDTPADRYVYDESYRVVVNKPLFLVLRVAAVARVLNQRALKLGWMAEHVFETGRKPVWRAGPVVALQLTNHLEAVAGVSLNVSGPDDLGLALGAYGLGGLRYRWATGEPKPELPWRGELIPFR